MNKLLLPLLGLLLPLLACGDNHPVGPEAEGSLSFTYSGDISGTLAVSGGTGPDQERYPQNEFAAAVRGRDGLVQIDGVRPTRHPKLDFVAIRLEGVTGPKTITICANLSVAPDCPYVQFRLGDNVSQYGFDHGYEFTSGSITISEITRERVRGSFQGTAVRLEPMGQVNRTRTVTVTNGQFDVPFLPPRRSIPTL